MKKFEKYFGQHVYYNSAIHVLIGIGIGMMLTYPLAGSHPVRWGVGILVIGLLAYFYPLILNKK